MCDSSWPHGLQPSRLLCPWDSPGNYWSGLPCLSPGDLSDPGIKPRSPALQADSLPSKPPGKSVCVCVCACVCIHASMRAKSLWSCSTLCDLMHCGQPGSSVHWTLQAGILEWVAMPSSRGTSRPRDRTHVFCSSCLAGGFFMLRSLGNPCVCVCVCVCACVFFYSFPYSL